MTANSPDYNSVEELIQGELNKSIHLECGRETSRSVLAAVRSVYQKKRCAFYLESDKGFERDTVRSYLKFFARLAGSKITAKEVIDHLSPKSYFASAPCLNLVPTLDRSFLIGLPAKLKKAQFSLPLANRSVKHY